MTTASLQQIMDHMNNIHGFNMDHMLKHGQEAVINWHYKEHHLMDVRGEELHPHPWEEEE